MQALDTWTFGWRLGGGAADTPGDCALAPCGGPARAFLRLLAIAGSVRHDFAVKAQRLSGR